jgi:hypothetical protein
MAIKYINVFQPMALQNFPKLGFLLKINHLATLVQMKTTFFFPRFSATDLFPFVVWSQSYDRDSQGCAGKIYNATSSLVRFHKKVFFYVL